MKVSDIIRRFEQIKEEYGDLEVVIEPDFDESWWFDPIGRVSAMGCILQEDSPNPLAWTRLVAAPGGPFVTPRDETRPAPTHILISLGR